MGNNYELTKFQSNAMNMALVITWILYVAILFGLSANAPDYLDELQYYVRLYVSLFLIYRFNPFRRVKFTFLDAKIGFSAGIFLLTTIFIGNSTTNIMDNIKKYI